KTTGILKITAEITGHIYVNVVPEPDIYKIVYNYVLDGVTQEDPFDDGYILPGPVEKVYGDNTFSLSFIVKKGYNLVLPVVFDPSLEIKGPTSSTDSEGTTTYVYELKENAEITHSFTITITVEPDEYYVIFDGEGFIAFRGDIEINQDLVKHGYEYELRFMIADGYVNDPAKVQAALSAATENNVGSQGTLQVGPFNTFYTLLVKNVQGTIHFEINTVKTWTITADVSNATAASIVSPMEEGSKPQFTLSANSGYRLPDSITVTMGVTTLSQGASDYTYELSSDKMSATFTLTIDGGITGDLVITEKSVKTWVITLMPRPGLDVGPYTGYTTTVDDGADFMFVATTYPTYVIKSVGTIPDTGPDSIEETEYDEPTETHTYKIHEVKEDLIVYVSVFKTWTINADVSNATTTPSPLTSPVDDGDPLQFTLSAAEGYRLPEELTVTMAATLATLSLVPDVDYTYTLSPDRTSASFTLTRPGAVIGDVEITGASVKTWTVEINVSDGGSAEPTVVSPVDDESTLQEYTLSAAAKYRLPDTITVTMGGETVPSEDYTYNKLTGEFSLNVPVTGNVVVDVTCVKIWDVTVPTGTGYIMSPSGVTVVDDGSSFTFTLSAAAGYRIDRDIVGIDGDGVKNYTGPDAGVYTYTITNIKSDITVVIDLDSLIKTWDVTLSDGKGYVLDPAGGVYTLDETDPFTFTVEVLPGYRILDPFVTIYSETGSGTLSMTQISDNVYEFTISDITGDISVSVDVEKLYTVNVTYDAGTAFEYSWDGWETVYTPELDPEGGVYTFEVPEGSVLLMRALNYGKNTVIWDDDVSSASHRGPTFIGPSTRGGEDIEELNVKLIFTVTVELEWGSVLWMIMTILFICSLVSLMFWVRTDEKTEEEVPDQ
ncbi:MAG: hypothetical protein LBE48_01905, partial [Methanomassiliicoccaceae archaeon]|nr:hypothetical protein [Methanomassiliicoccaceae archaeon]